MVLKLRNLLMSGMALLTCAMMSTGCSLSSNGSAAADEPAEFVAEPNQIVQHADQYKGKKINTVIQVKLVQTDKIIGTESIAMGPNFTIEYKAQGNEKEIQKGDYLRVIGTVDEINEKGAGIKAEKISVPSWSKLADSTNAMPEITGKLPDGKDLELHFAKLVPTADGATVDSGSLWMPAVHGNTYKSFGKRPFRGILSDDGEGSFELLDDQNAGTGQNFTISLKRDHLFTTKFTGATLRTDSPIHYVVKANYTVSMEDKDSEGDFPAGDYELSSIHN